MLGQWAFIWIIHGGKCWYMDLVCVNSLWPSDTEWWHRAGSTLAQVMAWCLTAPSHYLNQCWLIREALWHSPEINFTASAPATILYNEFKNYTLRITATFPRDQWSMSLIWHQITWDLNEYPVIYLFLKINKNKCLHIPHVMKCHAFSCGYFSKFSIHSRWKELWIFVEIGCKSRYIIA